MYTLLDIFFLIFHSSLVLFVLTAWLWRRTRRLHLFVMALVCLSWFGLGYFYGFGYCPSTDWHWQVKERLGETDLPASFVTYCLGQLTGRRWDDRSVGYAVVAIGITISAISIVLNFRDWRRRVEV